MKILVTGCFGFIGSNLVSRLLNDGHEIIGLDNLVNCSIDPTDRIKSKSGQNWSNFKFYQADIRDFNSIKSIASNYMPDYIIHLAALGSVPRSFAQPSEVMDVNVKGFTNMMMLATMLNCKRIVFASSSSVYGDDQSKTRTEETIGNQLSPYALSKYQNEQFAKIWCKNISLEYVGLRFFNVYGEGQLINSAYSAVIPKFINSNEITIFGDGKTIRDFTHVSDVCRAIELSLKTEKFNDIYNVGTGSQTDLNKLAFLCGKGRKNIKNIEERPYDIKESIASIFKAQIFLKFKAGIDIEDGIERTIDYYESIKNKY